MPKFSWIFLSLSLVLSSDIFADNSRLRPIVIGSLELHDTEYSDDQVELFSERFSQLEAVLGNSKTYLWVTKSDELIHESAQNAACEMLADDCYSSKVSDAIAATLSISDSVGGYSSLSIKLGKITYRIIFLSEADNYQNERSILAFRAFTELFIEDQSTPDSEIPEWWRDGQEEYLTKVILSSMRLEQDNSFGSFHNTMTFEIAGRVMDGAPLSILESNYIDISVAGIMRLVHDHGMKTVFVDFYDSYNSGLTWNDAFFDSFDITPRNFSETLEVQIKSGLDLASIMEPNDLLDALEEPWRLTDFSARSLFDIAPFKLIHSMAYTKAEGCPHTVGLASHEFGDFNGDGYQDIIFTVEEFDSFNQSVDIVCSAPTTIIAIYGGENNKDPNLSIVDTEALGARDTVMADVNNDGFDDVLVVGGFHKDGSYSSDSPPISSMNLYLGSANGLVKSTSTLVNETELDLGDMAGEFATYGDIDGDGVPEFFFYGLGAGDSWPQPIVIDCSDICTANYPAGFDSTKYPKLSGVTVYNGALIDIDQDSDLDILINIEVDPSFYKGESFVENRYAHAVYLQQDGSFDLSALPKEFSLGFRLNENKIQPIPDDDRSLDINATHYWESEVIDLTGDGIAELVTLENNQFHVLNSRFLISIYSPDSYSSLYTLSSSQPEDTKLTHDQNLNFRDLNGDSKLDIVSSLHPGSIYEDTIAVHQSVASGWSLSTKGFNAFMQENYCLRVYTPDFNSDGNLDVLITCPRGDILEVYYGSNDLIADRDRDGMSDELEILNGTNPNLADSDSDGINDLVDHFPLNPSESIDSDSDGVGNNADADNDNDGVNDDEDAFPLNSLYSTDSDSDGMPDSWELKYGLNPNDPSDAASDQDNDGANALAEFLAGTIPAGSIDIDGNGEYKALTDGLLLLRGMFGLTGDALIGGAVASDAVYTTSVDIEAHIAMLGTLADIDGNGDVSALTDGLLALRYLFGLTGDALISGVIASDATRTTSAEIEAHIQSLTPAL